MCQIFAGQDPENYSYVSRSIRLDGQVTVFGSRVFTGRYLMRLPSRKVLQRQGLSRSCTVRSWTSGPYKTSPSLLRSACLIHMDNRLATAWKTCAN